MKIILDGNSISDIEDFYDQTEKHLSTGECPWGRNLDSLDEIVLCNFNYTDAPSLNVTEILWTNASSSALKLGGGSTRNLFKVLTEILSSNKTIKLILA